MRLLALALVALPSLASARPFTAGVGIGRTQAKADASGDASGTAGIFARLGVARRIGIQGELAKIDDTIRTGTALIVVDLGSHPHIVPTIAAGFGFDHGQTASGSHIEGGFGLEYRASGGLVIGAEFRLGGRSITQQVYYADVKPGVAALYAPEPLHEGEYRSARLVAAVQF